MAETYYLKKELEEANEKYKMSDVPFGVTLLTGVNNISSSRTIMFTNHRAQFVNLNNPEFPKVFTGYENMIGEHSTAKYKVDRDFVVKEKIVRFPLSDEYKEKELYTLVVYDPKNDYYDLITKKKYEDLTEKFGFEYTTEKMDKLEPGDEIDKGDILYYSSSYDEDGNYRYGKNVPFIYLVENQSIEDGLIASESLSNSMTSKEIITIKVSLNDNDFFCNLYGDANSYRGFPNIGEEIKNGVVCSKRRIFNEQKLFDLMDKNLRNINFASDDIYYGKGRIADITIYCNKKPIDEIVETPLNAQMLKYLKEQEKYYRAIYEATKAIINSGSKYSKDVSYIYKKAKDILDPDILWRDEASVFGNMVIEFLIEKDVKLSVGQKLTGRYGNKGVVAKILPDDEMPYLENGKQIHLCFNTNGVINRMNAFQLYEQSITFICNRTQERMRELKTKKQKADLLLKLIYLFNEKEGLKLKEYYEKMSPKEQEEFIERVSYGAIYVNIPPFWHDIPLFERLKNIYKEFDWIKPYDVYINKFGRKIKLINPLVCGDMYIMKLKQTSAKGFSVRATGSINNKGLPGKSNKAKTNRELYSNTPIRIGDQESTNMMITNDVDTVKKLHCLYRFSTKGRRTICKKLLKGKPIKDIKIDDSFKNRNVEILNAYLKVMGLKLVFDDDFITVDIEDTKLYTEKIGHKELSGTREQLSDFQKVFNEIKRSTITTDSEFNDIVDKAIERQRLIHEGYIFVEIED
ncbi:MAG: hypothetical protein PHF63_00305 [Herbinix sp.]|nr:hypothetical protein [Herbinix sp.]